MSGCMLIRSAVVSCCVCWLLQAFRADGLKIYPTLVIRGTGLYELWRTGRYKNYTPNVLVDVVARILALVPPWTRVYRVQRQVALPDRTYPLFLANFRDIT